MVNRFWTAMMAATVAGSAMAQAPAVLYTSIRTAKEQGISLTGWGSGRATETDEVAYDGTNSVRITTRNLFQGGILMFANPVNLASAYGARENLLRLTYKLAGTTGGVRGGNDGGGGGLAGGAIGGGGGRQGGGGARPGGMPGGFPGGMPGGMPGGIGGRPGGPGGFGQPTQAGAKGLETVRAIVTTTDGKKSEAYIPVTSNAIDERGWSNLAIPLQAIVGFDRTNKVIKSVAFSADDQATFYLGDLRVVNDSTPIRGEIENRGPLNIGASETVIFRSSGTGGASLLKYTWDFDAADGIQIDAEGQSVRRRFRRPGTFTVTLTVSDYFGLKTPYSTTLKITVNP